jgi:AraC-like DNA-binding protein
LIRFKKGSKSVFRKHLLLFLLTILIPTVLILSFQVYRVSKDAILQTENVSIGKLDRMARNLDIVLEQLDQITLQISLTPDVLELLTRPFGQPAYQYAQVKEQLRSWMTSNPLFQSLYLEILQNRKVLTTSEGIYDEADFYDGAFMKELQSASPARSTPWIGLRRSREDGNNEVLTFAKLIPPTQSAPLGLLALNLRKELFLKTVMSLNNEKPDRVLVFDPEGRLISAPIAGFDADQAAALATVGKVYTEAVRVEGTKYILAGRRDASNGWIIVQLTPMEAYNRQVAAAVRQSVLICLLVLAVGIGLSYLFASILYDPWRKLADRLQGFGLKNSAENRDAYTFVNHAIHNLLAVIRKNEPIVRDHLVYDLLHDHMPDAESTADLFRHAGFVFPHFAVLVVLDESMEERNHSAQRLLYLFSLAEETLRSRFPSAGTILERARFGFILNVDSGEFDAGLEARIEDACREIRRLASERFQAELSFCVSSIRPQDRLHEAYEQVKRTLAYKAFMSSDIYFAGKSDGSAAHFRYPAAYQKLLLGAILSGDREAAEGYAAELFEQYLIGSGYPYDKLLQTIIMLMSHVLSSLISEGYDIGPLMDEIDLLQLQQCVNRHELQQLIIRQIGRVIGYLESVREKTSGYGAAVKQAIAYMNEHYSDNLSMADVAGAAGISASHLSRCFKAEVGKSPQEYLTELRIGISKQLLADKSLSLQQIIGMIGYNDVHTFIRSFKKVEGTTPGEYRKRRLNGM